MSFSSTALQLVDTGNITGGRQFFIYSSTDTHSAIEATGYFTGCGPGGRGMNRGMQIGDLVLNALVSTAGSSAATLHVVNSSTADQLSTSGSSGWGANYNVTVTPATT